MSLQKLLGLNVSAEGIKRRDELIFHFALEVAKNPIVMVLSGSRPSLILLY